MNDFSFSPSTGLLDTSAYPTQPSTEADARGQVMSLFTQIKNYLNNVVKIELASKTQENWAAPTLVNGWSNKGGVTAPAGYFKDTLGLVHLRGIITGGTVTSGTILFNLPAGYRPAYSQYFTVSSGGGSSIITDLEISSDGNVKILQGGANTFLSLDIPSFRAEL